jgi:Flp pilus assembly pilin Flp
MLMSLRSLLHRTAAKVMRDEDGAGVVEVIMIIAVVIIVAIIFRDQLISFVRHLMDRAETTSNDMFNY